MIRVAVIDDEVKSRTNLIQLLQRFCPDVTIVLEAGSISEGLPALVAARPDLLILDIEMPDGTGFDLLDMLPGIDFELVFVTAYNEYAIKAIKANAVDYLLKPLDIKELQKAVLKAEARIHEKARLQNTAIPPAMTNQSAKDMHRIAIAYKDGFEFVTLDSIIHLSSNGSYTEIYCDEDKRYLCSKPLKDYEDLLPPALFFRVHHSHIINLEYVKHYHRGDGGYLTMSNGSEICLSRRKKKEFLELFNQ